MWPPNSTDPHLIMWSSICWYAWNIMIHGCNTWQPTELWRCGTNTLVLATTRQKLTHPYCQETYKPNLLHNGTSVDNDSLNNGKLSTVAKWSLTFTSTASGDSVKADKCVIFMKWCTWASDGLSSISFRQQSMTPPSVACLLNKVWSPATRQVQWNP